MELYFLRHGIAADSDGIKIKSDADRPLTQEGADKIRESVEGMGALGLEFDRVFSSPYLRARQTAEIVVKHLPCKTELKLLDLLVPHGAYDELFDMVQKLPFRGRYLMVGHEPHISQSLSRLIGAGSLATLEIGKGSLACVDLQDASFQYSGSLVWLMTSKQLRGYA